ncbi:MAG: Hsp20/alpha crystallin family protein [Ruminococcus sp.]
MRKRPKRKKAKDGTYLRRERSTSSYEQKLDISNVDASGLHAVYENGVLTLTMPKKQPAKPVSRQLEIH